MPTPAPHTPIMFTRGGASMAWSAACVKALMDCGYHPDDFGDYDHVQKRCRTARRKVEKQQIYDDAPQPKPPPSPPNPGPTPHEYFLAESQSGHLTQDATQRSAGARGGSACDNHVDGYDGSAAPCMPHHGSAQTFGTQHNVVSVMESEQPYAVDPPPAMDGTAKYPPDQLDSDTRDRTKAALDHRLDARNPGAQPTSDPYAAAGQPGYFGNESPESVADPAAVDKGTVISPASDPDGRSPSEVASECIDAFRKEAELAAKKPWLPPEDGQTEQQAFDRHIAGLEEQRAAAEAGAEEAAKRGADEAREEQQKLQQELEDLTRRSDTPGSDGEKRDGELRRAQNARQKAHKRDASEATLEKNDQRVQDAYDERERLQTQIDSLQDTIDGCDRQAEKARGIGCEIEQAHRIHGTPGHGPEQNEPRVPTVNPFLGQNPDTGVNESDRIRRDVADRRTGGAAGAPVMDID